MIKAVILDLDDTLYDYERCHFNALVSVFSYIKKVYEIEILDLHEVYKKVSFDLKSELKNTASSHNRTIYFKSLLNHFSIPLINLFKIVEIYWKRYYETMTLNQGVSEFLQLLTQNQIKIYILTDFTLTEQIKKLEVLNILPFIQDVISSEEVGIEKPSRSMFLHCLDIIGLKKHEVVMIGDNKIKDINGAINVGLFSFWFNKNSKAKELELNNQFGIFNSFSQLTSFFDDLILSVDELISLSKYCGQRFDLIQFAGGNTSVKTNNLMLIKSSGKRLVDMERDQGYSLVLNNFKDEMLLNHERASMETSMHSFLKKYTIHLHPIQVNKILVRKDAKEIIRELFPESLVIDYNTPGEKLSSAIKEKYNGEEVIFLLNHGLIITSDNFNSLNPILETVLTKCENFIQNPEISYNEFDIYKNVSVISYIMSKVDRKFHIIYLIQDERLIDFLNQTLLYLNQITFPDQVIYYQLPILEVDYYSEEFTEGLVLNYFNTNGYLPKIIKYKFHYYIISTSLNNCRGIEELIKATYLINEQNPLEINTLTEQNISELNNLDSEKYRKSLK